MKHLLLICLFLALFATANDGYEVTEIEPPEGCVLEIGDLQFTDDGTLMMCTRRGEVWSLKDGNWKRFAHGLQEPLGLIVGDKPGEYYILQRPELTRLVDRDGDGLADRYETFAKGWGFSANYHEYAMGLARDKGGNFYFGLGLPFSHKKNNKFQGQWLGTIDVKDRGWYIKIGKDGSYGRVAPGVREPVGSAINEAGDIFITDTQGSYIATNYIMHVEPDAFLGHPDGLLWDKEQSEQVNAIAALPDAERNAALDKMRKRPVVYIPYREMGSSVGGNTFDTTGGKFGPYAGQMFVAEVIQPLLMRASIEQVDGVYQGAIMAFYRGGTLAGGSHKMAFDKAGDMYVGQTARGWGSGHGLKKVHFTGNTPTDVKDIRIAPAGFTLTFTKPVDPETAGKPETYALSTFQYNYSHVYNAGVRDRHELKVTAVKLADDGLSATLSVDGLKTDYVVLLDYTKLRAPDGSKPPFGKAWYTINKLR